MSDIVLNAGTGGANLGTDQVTGTPNIDWQVVKIGFSAPGVTPVQVSTTNVLPVGFQTAQPVIQSGSWTVSLSGAIPAGANTIGAVNLAQYTPASGRLPVDGSGVTQPVSGTFWQATQPISAVALPLPTGASTAAKQPALGTAGTASTDVITVQGIAGAVAVPVSGTFWQATQPVSGTVTANAGTGSFTVVQATAANLNATASQGGTWTVQPGNTANTTPWLMTDVAATNQGVTPFTLVSAATNNLTLVKSSACGLYHISVQNLASTPVYLKLFNAASTGAVTPGTTAATCQYMIPGNTAGSGLVVGIPTGLDFSFGLVIMVTAGISLTDNTPVAANNQVVTLGYT